MQHDPSPVNPLPPVVWVLFLLLAGVEIVFQAGENGLAGGPNAIGWRIAVAQEYGFSGAAFDWMVQNGRWPLEHLLRFVSYLFVHPTLTATVFSAVMLLALGKLVGETLGQVAVVVLFAGAGLFGALIFGLLTDQEWLLGAFPGVYGLIGGYTYLMWVKLGQEGKDQKQAFVFIAFLMGIQLFFSIFFQSGLDWVADLAGFACGFALSPTVAPGGFRRLVNRLR
jgi:membrane associated rhomboid family serine protease